MKALTSACALAVPAAVHCLAQGTLPLQPAWQLAICKQLVKVPPPPASPKHLVNAEAHKFCAHATCASPCSLAQF